MTISADFESEGRIISAILFSESACAETFSRVGSDDFSDPFIRELFLVALSLYRRGVHPTYVELLHDGHESGLIKGIEDREKVKEIAEKFIADKNVKYWIDRVKEAAKKRKIRALLQTYNEEINSNIDVPEFIQRIGADFMALALDGAPEQIESGAELASFGNELLKTTSERWRELQSQNPLNGQIPLDGVPTGIKTLDEITLGYKPGDLIILGAQTGHGKTAFALNSAKAASIDGGMPCLYVNTEMSREQIALRWGAILAGVPLQKIRTGSVSDAEIREAESGFQRLADSGFCTSTIPNLTPAKLLTLAQKAKLQNGIQFLILDYVGRMEKRNPQYQEWQILEDIVKSCKLMAQNLEIAVMCLVQLNYDGTLQGAKRMKNEADLMLQLFPLDDGENERRQEFERKYKKQIEPSFNYYLHIAKSRDSDSGISIPLVFDKGRQQIREAQELANVWHDVGEEREDD